MQHQNQAVVSSEAPLIMIVDDEVSICDTLANVLQDESFATIVAHDGPAALETISRSHPAVVFLDIWMPGWDGLETLEKIKQVAPTTEVIVISGHANIANALEAKRRGAFDFIEKPLDLESIILLTNRALEQRERVLAAEATETRVMKVITGERSAAVSLTHKGVTSTGLTGRNLGQRTLKRSAILYGQGLHSGQKSGLVLEPLPLNSGIHFGQIGTPTTVPAFIDFVESTNLATTIRRNGWGASTIEHLMSALHAYRISNLLIKCNREVPILDGSALQFCKLIEEVGIEEQGGEWFELAVDRRYEMRGEPKPQESTEEMWVEPADDFIVTYELNYPEPVGQQRFTYRLSDIETYKSEIAPARTFGFMKDIERLQKAGLAAGGRLDNFILIGHDKIVNTELRFPDELVRHKILDVIGDLFLLGRPIRGHVTARMTGHSDNIQLLSTLRSGALAEG